MEKFVFMTIISLLHNHLLLLRVTEDAETAVTAVGQNITSRHSTDANRSSVVSNKSGSLNHKAPSKANGK